MKVDGLKRIFHTIDPMWQWNLLKQLQVVELEKSNLED